MRRSITWQGAFAGAIGGFIGSWVMNKFQDVWSATEKRISKNNPQAVNEQARSQKPEPAPVKVTTAAVQAMMHRAPSEWEKKTGSQIVHYAFGTAMGLLYGAIADKTPKARSGGGTLFAASLWLGADEIVVPALKLSPPPADSPVSTHTFGLASHLIYGLTVEGVRRGILAAVT